MDISNNSGIFSPRGNQAKPAVPEIPTANKGKSGTSNGKPTAPAVDTVTIKQETYQQPVKESQFRNVYAVSNKVFSLFQINGQQFTRERNLETGEVVYFPEIDEVNTSGYQSPPSNKGSDLNTLV